MTLIEVGIGVVVVLATHFALWAAIKRLRTPSDDELPAAAAATSPAWREAALWCIALIVVLALLSLLVHQAYRDQRTFSDDSRVDSLKSR